MDETELQLNNEWKKSLDRHMQFTEAKPYGDWVKEKENIIMEEVDKVGVNGRDAKEQPVYALFDDIMTEARISGDPAQIWNRGFERLKKEAAEWVGGVAGYTDDARCNAAETERLRLKSEILKRMVQYTNIPDKLKKYVTFFDPGRDTKPDFLQLLGDWTTKGMDGTADGAIQALGAAREKMIQNYKQLTGSPTIEGTWQSLEKTECKKNTPAQAGSLQSEGEESILPPAPAAASRHPGPGGEGTDVHPSVEDELAEVTTDSGCLCSAYGGGKNKRKKNTKNKRNKNSKKNRKKYTKKKNTKRKYSIKQESKKYYKKTTKRSNKRSNKRSKKKNSKKNNRNR